MINHFAMTRLDEDLFAGVDVPAALTHPAGPSSDPSTPAAGDPCPGRAAPPDEAAGH
ncbi:hypothetical protein GCM10010106_13890 [Thermopolyspora flexuosa]|uniref:Uncharacterized protein n=1 Tax=Thermopolyspora flexuosa TaxID=103836 RepID=A0A543IPY8_9ACTN|nr:hypothetical protein [Thermopolyspora flexuosa]TQM72641.1 hypothetical protein FHX40_4794 [Thermopolyspora flexuosa]GGM68988.1 hypothetical protein GCM10010106_13890 [Thermopolyspora flexuosa]